MTSTRTGRLAEGLRVVEVGSSAAVAVAGMVLADAGAEVVMVEPPPGSPLREQAAFPMWGRGKQSVLADLASDAGRDRVLSLVDEADLLLVGLKPSSALRFGLGYESLAPRNERLVHVAVSGFGYAGPYTDVPWYEGSMAAKAGRMWEFSALAGGERPAFAAAPVLSHGLAMLVLQGAFAALRERLRTGRGQRVESSLAQAYSIYDMIYWWPGAPREVRLEDVPFVAYSVARTKDGVWLQFAQNGPALFADFLRVIGLEGLADYGSVMGGSAPEALRALRERIQQRMQEHTWEEWQQRFEGERNISVEPFWAPGEALRHPQLTAIGDSIELADPERGPTRQLGPLVDCPARPLAPAGPAPTPGSLGDAGFAPRPAPAPAPGGAAGDGLLDGVTVLELGMWIALPFAGSLLSDLGARVIKLEPLSGDPMRSTGPAIAMKMMQGKETLCLDLKREEAREIVHRLVARADALLHSYRPGVPERLGIDFETLAEINPRLVHLYNGSYGSRGPKAFAAAFHVTGGAVCGGAFAQAGEDTPPPPEQTLELAEIARISRRLERANEANPDFNSAVAAAAAACMALYASEVGQEGLALETRMMLSNAYMMSPWFVEHAEGTPPPLPDRDLLGLSPLYRLYRAGEGWVFLAAPGPRDFDRLCAALDAPELVRRFPDAEARARRGPDGEALSAALEEIFRSRAAESWERELAKHGISCMRADVGPFASWIFDEPWAREIGLVEDVAESEIGAYPRYGACVRGERTPALGGGFAAGRDTRSLLAWLGFEESEIEALHAQRVVGSPA